MTASWLILGYFSSNKVKIISVNTMDLDLFVCFGKSYIVLRASSLVAGSAVICLQSWRPRFDPWVRKIPWRKAWQPTPVFLPGESHEQRHLVGYGP